MHLTPRTRPGPYEIVSALGAVLTIALAPIGSAAQDAAALRVSRAVEAVGRAVAASTRPGMAVAITDRERTLGVFVHGYADLKVKTPLTAGSLFAIGSISKSFTAIALMQLADEGRFDPTAPITIYLPWFTLKSPRGIVTGHHLLTHTAGIPNYRADLASMPFATFALRDFEPSYAPGEHYWYSNLGFQTLGYALERIEGASYASIIRRRIFDPVGMHASVATIDDRVRLRLPVSYRRWPGADDFVEEPWFEYSAADGSIVATAADMAAYARVILNRGRGPTGRILSERAFERLTTPVLANYAYGLNVLAEDGGVEVSHGGAIAGFGSILSAHMTDGFAIVMLGNAGVDRALARWATSALKAAVRNQPLPEFAPPPAPSVDEWTGTYTARDGRTVVFVANAGQLTLKRGNDVAALTQVGADAFGETAGDPAAFPFAFERVDGRVTAVARGSDWYTRGAYSGQASFEVPAEYRSFSGRYKNHNPEGSPIRVFVRGASLYLAGGINDGGRRLVRVGPATFRPESPDYNPERLVFDSIVDGRALRVLVSGMPMYRVDDRRDSQ